MLKTRIHTIKHISQLIAEEKTGSPRELADKTGMNERNIYYYIKLLKWAGAPIIFDKEKKSYRFEGGGEFIIAFRPYKQTLH